MNAFNFNDYILKCDYLYKYQIFSVHGFPVPKSLKLSISSKQFKVFLSQYSALSLSETSVQANLYIFFLILLSYKPIINFTCLEENNFNLVFTLKKKIFLFLFNNLPFFYSSLSEVPFQNVRHLKKKDTCLSYFSKINFLNFSDLKLYQKDILNSVLSNDMSIDTNFILKFKK